MISHSMLVDFFQKTIIINETAQASREQRVAHFSVTSNEWGARAEKKYKNISFIECS